MQRGYKTGLIIYLSKFVSMFKLINPSQAEIRALGRELYKHYRRPEEGAYHKDPDLSSALLIPTQYVT